jgi:hypothetical protein
MNLLSSMAFPTLPALVTASLIALMPASAGAQSYQLNFTAQMDRARLSSGQSLPDAIAPGAKIRGHIRFSPSLRSLNKPMPKIVDGAALYYVNYRVHVDGALNASFDAKGFMVRDGTLVLGVDPLGCGPLPLRMSSKGVGAQVPVTGGSSRKDAAGQPYTPGKFVLAQSGHSRADLPLEEVLQNVALNALKGETRLLVELHAEATHNFGPRLVFGVTSMHFDPNLQAD